MNERIKELIQKASSQTSEAFASSNNFRHFEWEALLHEKFAELIVKDCLDEIWYDMTPKQISDNIKRKFGLDD